MQHRLMRRRAAALLALALSAAVVHAADTPERIVSLGGDVTEILFAVGAGDAVVARDSTSLWPPEAQRLPDVGYVRSLGAEGVLSLQPDLIIATADAGPPPVIRQLQGAGARIARLPPTRTPADIEAKIRRIGTLSGHAQAADTLADAIRAQADALARQVAEMDAHPRVVFLMTGNHAAGLMAAGGDTAADAAIRLAGGINAVDDFVGYKPLSAEALVALAPDVLLMMQQRHGGAEAMAALQNQPGIAATPAGAQGRIWAVDGLGLLGFGPRTIELAAELHTQLRGAAAR